MAIGNVDREVTAKLKKRIDRQVMESQRSFVGNTNVGFEEPVAGPSGLCDAKVTITSNESDNDSDTSLSKVANDEDFIWSYSLEKRPKLKEEKMERSFYGKQFTFQENSQII